MVNLLAGGEHRCAVRFADQFGSRVLKHETRASAPENECEKPHRIERRWGVQKQAVQMAAYFITNPTDYPLKCRGFPGSLRWEENVSG